MAVIFRLAGEQHGAVCPAQQVEQIHAGECVEAAAESCRALGEAVGDGIKKLQLFVLCGVVQIWRGGYEDAEVGGSDAEAGR